MSQVQHVAPTASWGRRILALMVDWLASSLVVIGLVGWSAYFEVGSPYTWWTTGVWVLEITVFTALLGGSFGQLVTRLRVVRDNGDPKPIGLLTALMRSVLIALVIPPLVFKPDGRGLHDLAAGTRTIAI